MCERRMAGRVWHVAVEGRTVYLRSALRGPDALPAARVTLSASRSRMDSVGSLVVEPRRDVAGAVRFTVQVPRSTGHGRRLGVASKIGAWWQLRRMKAAAERVCGDIVVL